MNEILTKWVINKLKKNVLSNISMLNLHEFLTKRIEDTNHFVQKL